jgi:hypothetical protein
VLRTILTEWRFDPSRTESLDKNTWVRFINASTTCSLIIGDSWTQKDFRNGRIPKEEYVEKMIHYDKYLTVDESQVFINDEIDNDLDCMQVLDTDLDFEGNDPIYHTGY